MNAKHWTVAATLLAAAAMQSARADDDWSTRIAACTREAIEKRARGELVFSLDNGQVWAQTEVGAYFPIAPGNPVTILAGTLGSHRLVVGNRATAVTRVR